jgi:pimeloyl-ACP methyl ester carboxylesterase
VVGLIDAAGRERALLVGHDWGGAVAWRAAQDFPERIERLAILNGPHPSVMVRELCSNPRQLAKSWYLFFFQTPVIPERALLFNNAEWLARFLRQTARAGTFDESSLARYRTAWQEPGAMKAMLTWYRAALQLRPPRPAFPRVAAPTLVIWGRHDAFLEPSLGVRSVEKCDSGHLVIFEESTHWLPIEESQRVNQHLYQFFHPD